MKIKEGRMKAKNKTTNSEEEDEQAWLETLFEQ